MSDLPPTGAELDAAIAASKEVTAHQLAAQAAIRRAFEREGLALDVVVRVLEVAGTGVIPVPGLAEVARVGATIVRAATS